MKYVTKAFVFWVLREGSLPRDVARYITEVHVPWVPKGMPTISLDRLGVFVNVRNLYLHYPGTEMPFSVWTTDHGSQPGLWVRINTWGTWIDSPLAGTGLGYRYCTWCGRVDMQHNLHFSHVGVPGDELAVLACPACVSAIALAESK
jgi:hypothetical protein